MKRLNQAGLAPIYIAVALIVVAAGGWFAYSRVKQADPPAAAPSQTAAGEDKAKPKPKNLIKKVDIKLRTADDLSKLPSNTPKSFKAFMLELIKNSKPDADNCYAAYSVSRISPVNIEGGGFVANTMGAHHDAHCPPGGAPSLWVLAPGGNWDWLGRNNNTPCQGPGGGLVYEEFAKKCYKDENLKTYIDNPNGSIYEADL